MTPRSVTPREIVARLGGLQAQDYPAAKWAIALRGRGLVDAEIERAFNGGEIIRTHLLRPTWHFVAPEDLRWLLQLTAPRVHLANGHYYRAAGIDAKENRRSTALLERTLRDRNYRTRAELGDVLQRGRIDTTRPHRLGYLLMRAELDGVICSGPLRGRQHTYALVEERVPPAAPLAHDEALHELAHRYIETRGPATAHDFAWFAGLTVAGARRALESLGGTVERTEIGGRTHWARGSGRMTPMGRRVAHLLPNYDEYFIGLRDRGAILERARSGGVPMPAPALERHVVAIGGQLVGGWRRSLSDKAVTVELELITPLTRSEQQALTRAVEAYGDFLQRPVEVRS